MNIKSKPKNQSSQLQVIRNHLFSGGTITTMEAFSKHGITRLPAIIYILREKEKFLLRHY